MTVSEYKEQMLRLSVAFRKQLTRPVLTLYWEQFRDVDAAHFARAVDGCIKTDTWFPTVAQIRRALGQGGGTLAEAGLTFTALLGPAPHYDPRRGDYWAIPDVMAEFGPQAVAAFLVAGGSASFRDRTDKTVEFLRRDFLRGWEEYNVRHGELAPVLHAATTRQGLGPIKDSPALLLPGTSPEEA